jgi:hypothetical protein
VADWLRMNLPGPATSDAELVRVCGATEKYVERCRFDQWSTDDPPEYLPDPEVYHGAVMYAGRETRRRNSPAGIEQFADGGTTFVSKYDSDIERALRTGSWNTPGVG